MRTSASPGERSGVKVGDRILLIGKEAPHPWNYDEPEFTRPVGTVVPLTVKRGETILHLKPTLQEVISNLGELR